jgi:ornithine cyclodeaminase
MRASLVSLSSKMLLLGERDVRRVFCLQECLDVNRKALISLTEKTGVVPSRLALPYPNNPNIKDAKKDSSNDAKDWTLIKPAAYYSPDDKQDITMGMKVVSVRANNPSKGLPLVPATIFLLDPATGIVEATISGTYLTVARTSAGPALAVQTFQPQAQHLVIFGAGAQAECHIELMELALKRKIPRISIINRSTERAEALKTKLLADRDTPVEVILLSDSEAVASALSTADVVAATTNTATPLWEDGSVLKKGCLITGIGSYTPDMQEIPESAVNLSHVIIDTPEAMEVGDLKHLGSHGSSSHPVTLAGDALADPSDIGRTMDYIFYKAVGTAIQDVLTAQNVVERAKNLGVGQEIDMS